MSEEKDLRGGLGNGSEMVSALSVAIGKIAARKNRGAKLNALCGSRRPEDEMPRGIMTARDLSSLVEQLAKTAYEYVLLSALPFLRDFELEKKEVPEIVLEKGEKAKECEDTINDLRFFEPQNDPDEILEAEFEVAKEAGNEGRVNLINAMCLRVRRKTEIALLVFACRHAETKAELEGMLENTVESLEENAKIVFKGGTAKSPIWAFGRGYELTKDVFGGDVGYRLFAQTQLAEAISARSKELAIAHNAETKAKKSMMSLDNGNRITVEKLLFNDDDVDQKTAVIEWQYGNRPNGLELKRVGNRLFVMNAIGKPEETLAQMKDRLESNEYPFIFLKHLLSKDGEHLCEEISEGRFQFCEIIERDTIFKDLRFKLTVWARVGAGYCVPPNRFIGGQKVKNSNGNNGNSPRRIVKDPGQLCTQEEFYFHHALGSYDLLFLSGFRYRFYGEDRQVSSSEIVLAEDATARISRNNKLGKDYIQLESTTSENLADLLEKAGVEFFEERDGQFLYNVEYQDTPGWKGFPVPLANALKLDFGRLKERSQEMRKEDANK